MPYGLFLHLVNFHLLIHSKYEFMPIYDCYSVYDPQRRKTYMSTYAPSKNSDRIGRILTNDAFFFHAANVDSGQTARMHSVI